MGKAEKFIQLEQELTIYTKALTQASEIILNEEISRYPIFVAHQHEVMIGIPVLEKEKIGGDWNINASTLEEFVAKNIIQNEKIDEFRKNFKDAEHFLCVFVLSELGAQFVFLPKKNTTRIV
jgi:hypothetical protein